MKKEMKIWNFIIFVVALSMFFMISITTAASGTTIVTEEYWVLTDGYQGGFTNSGYITVSYGDFPPYITEEVFQIDYPDGGGPLQKYDSSGNLLQYGYRWQTGLGYCVVNPAVQFLPSSMETGQTYRTGWTRKEYSDSNSYLGEGSDNITVTVSGPESVTVPAGTFTTYKVHVVDSWRNSSGATGTSTSEYWLAKGVGWIKLIRGGITYELLYAPPTTTTGSATSLAANSATLNGTVNPNGGSTTYYFQYGTTTSYGSMTSSSSAGSGTSAVSISASLTGLNPSTTYHFRVKSSNSVGTSYGSDQSFTTTPDAPAVTTDSASSLTSSSATLHGTVNPNGAPTTYYFEYGTTTSYGSTTTSTDAGSETTDVSAISSITELISDITYHYRLVASNSYGESSGDDKTFTTTILYVDPLGLCGGNTPCYSTIQDAVDDAPTDATIKIAEGTYNEDVILNTSKTLTLQGGWDSTFTAQSSNTVISAPMTISNGKVKVKNIRVK